MFSLREENKIIGNLEKVSKIKFRGEKFRYSALLFKLLKNLLMKNILKKKKEKRLKFKLYINGKFHINFGKTIKWRFMLS